MAITRRKKISQIDTVAPEQEHDLALFIVGLLCQFCGLALLVFTIFTIPFLFFGVQYAVPEFVYHLRLPIEQGLADLLKVTVIVSPTLLLIVLFFFVARCITIRLEIQQLPDDHEKRKNVRITKLRWYTVLMLVFATVFMVLIMQWILYKDFLKLIEQVGKEVRHVF